jgi:ribosomal protein L16 Arg81 hydroxylase
MPALEFFGKIHRLVNATEEFYEITKGYLECTQHAGDIMYVPSLWGHSTLNTRQSIGVAHEFSIESFCME